MLCSICKERQATLHLTKIEGDKMQKLDLCDECAKANGMDDPSALMGADLTLGLGASLELDPGAKIAELKCSRCGFTQADFKKSGRLGCPECYVTFAQGLAEMLKPMHKGTRHVGKAPAALMAEREAADRLKTLEKKLARAIETEDFETAAAVRDQIKELKGAAPVKGG